MFLEEWCTTGHTVHPACVSSIAYADICGDCIVGVLHVFSALTLKGACILVSPVHHLRHGNRESNSYYSSSLRRCCPGERYTALVVGTGVGNSSHILQQLKRKHV